MIKARIATHKTLIKTMYYGLTGGHYDVIYFFSEKPKLDNEDWIGDVPCVDLNECQRNETLQAAMYLQDFKTLYPNVDVGRPKDIEVTEVFPIQLEIVLGDIIRYSADGWGNNKFYEV